MQSLPEIVSSLKKFKKLKNDDDVAKLLGTTTQALRSAKSRNLIPYEKILQFCEEEGISLDLIFLGKERSHFTTSIPEEKEYLDKFIKVLQNPATNHGIKASIDTMIQVPVSDSEAE